MTEAKERKMVTIVASLERSAKKEFYTNLGKFKKLIEQKWDQNQEDPKWWEIREAWQELDDMFSTYQAHKASMDIFHEDS